MIDKEKVLTLAQNAIDENPELFLLDVQFLANNTIKIFVDGDSGVPLKECVRISRAVEHNLDREKEDFSLEVSTPNISEPIVVKRQYKKNLNRILQVTLNEGEELEGKLISVTEEEIEIEWKAREPKPIGKGKVTVTHQRKIPYNNIKTAKVKITF